MTAPETGKRKTRASSPLPQPARLVPRRRPLTAARLVMWAMMAAGLALVGIFVMQVSQFQSAQETVLADKPIEDPKASVARGISFTGYDSNNQPFTIRASRAAQDKSAPNRVLLEEVAIDMTMKAKDEVLRVTAARGAFDDKNKTLDLEGNVEIANEPSYTASMERAQVLLRDKRLISKSPVEVRFPTGTITAGGMEMRDDGQQVYFTDTARAVFRGVSRDGTSRPEAP